MGCGVAGDLLHLQLDIAIDEVVIEASASLKERAVLVKTGTSLAQRTADSLDLLRNSGIDLAQDAIETGHQDRREGEVRIGG